MQDLGCKYWIQRGGVTVLLGLLVPLATSCERNGLRTAQAVEPVFASQQITGVSARSSENVKISPGVVLDESVPEKEEVMDSSPGLNTDGLRVVVLTPTSAKVVWTTPHASDSEVRWGRTAKLEMTPILQPEPVMQHVVLLARLEPGTTYFVQTASNSTGGSRVESPVTTFETLSDEVYLVRKSHPRIFFNSDDLPALRKRLLSSHSKVWGELRRACEGSLGKDSAKIAEGGSKCAYARAFAFAGLLDNDVRFKRKAEEIALACARLGGAGDKMDVRLRAMAVACVYDWIHADLSESTRGRLRGGMLEMYKNLENDSNDHEFVWGHSHGNHRPMVLVALALYGEDRVATENLDGLLGAYRKGFFATWRNYGDEGGSLKGWWYTTWTLDMEVEVLAAVASATNVNWFKTEVWFEKLIDWYLMAFRSDGTFLRSGDHRPNYTVSQFEWIYALCVAHHYKNGKAKWLAQRVAQSEAVWSLYNVFSILWDDPDVAPVAPSGSLSRFYRAPGQVLLRSSWGTDAVLANFRSASDYTLGHTHLDNNSFTLHYRGGLAINSGMYDSFGSSHHDNYYRRTIAHNSILVHDPKEKFQLYGKQLINDGGQRFLSPRLDGVRRSFPARIEEVLDPSSGYRAGGICQFEQGADFTYALGDAASSYAKEKLSRFDRHFLWLNVVDRHAKPAVVVLDDVVAKSPSFKKTYLLHTQERPTVDGRLVSTVNKDAVLLQETLIPQSPRIEVVGGPGREFSVQGENFPTTREPTDKDEVGGWRVEISPKKPSASETFLHILYADDVGQATRLDCALLPAEGLVGCTVERWAVLFGTGRRGVAEATYAVPQGAWRHLIAGVVPNATYSVNVDGRALSQPTASQNGMLRFDSGFGGKVELLRIVDSRPKPVVSAPLPSPELGGGGSFEPESVMAPTPSDLPPGGQTGPEEPGDSVSVEDPVAIGDPLDESVPPPSARRSVAAREAQ